MAEKQKKMNGLSKETVQAEFGKKQNTEQNNAGGTQRSDITSGPDCPDQLKRIFNPLRAACEGLLRAD